MSEAITVRDVLRLLWEADCYPRIGNHDWVVAAAMEDEALAKAVFAKPSPDDPPEFAVWLAALRCRDLSVGDREEIYWALHDYFGAEDPGHSSQPIYAS
jgi:hypothetical protein